MATIDPIDTASPIFQSNRRKIPKWVFLLLKEHHERLGLKIAAWSGPEGIGTPRFSFFFDRVRLHDGSPRYFFDFGDNTNSVEMQMYQAAIGVCSPLPGHPQLHPMQSKVDLRSSKVIPWLNEQLRIISLYHQLGDAHMPYTNPGTDWPFRRSVTCTRGMFSAYGYDACPGSCGFGTLARSGIRADRHWNLIVFAQSAFLKTWLFSPLTPKPLAGFGSIAVASSNATVSHSTSISYRSRVCRSRKSLTVLLISWAIRRGLSRESRTKKQNCALDRGDADSAIGIPPFWIIPGGEVFEFIASPPPADEREQSGASKGQEI